MLAISATVLMPVAASAEPASPAAHDQAIDVSDDPPASSGDTISVDTAAAAYARDYGVSLAEAMRRLDRIGPLQELLESLRDVEAERLAGWGIDHADDLIGWVLLTGDQPATATATDFADLHADVEVRLGAAHTLSELMTAQRRFAVGTAIGPVGSTGDQEGGRVDVAAVVTFTLLDMADNALHIGIDPALAMPAEPSTLGGAGDVGPIGSTDDPRASDAQLEAMRTLLTAALAGSIGVAYEVIDGRGVSSDAILDGGREMGDCTSGFAARHGSTGSYGVITAGHCSNSRSLNGVNLPWVAGYRNISADAQFHRVPEGSGHELRSTFRCNVFGTEGTCDVASEQPRYRMAGDYVCHTGMSSNFSCGTVTSIHYQPARQDELSKAPCIDHAETTQLTCNAVFVRVHGEHLRSCGGDSGGPWYRGSIAYGIHRGSNSENDCSRTGVYASFSSVGEVEQFLGVDLLHRQTVRFLS